MKKNLLKSMLFACAMGLGTSAWAQTTTLVSLPSDPETGWTEADATITTDEAEGVWDKGSSAPTVQVAKTILRISGGNGGYNYTKTIAPTENAIINVKALWRGRSDTGASYAQGNCSYFRFGNIVVAQNDQDKKHGYTFEGLDNISKVTTFEAGSYRVEIANEALLLIEMEINTASNTLTSFTIKSEDGATEYAKAENVVLANADYTTVAFGYWKSRRVGTTNTEDLKLLEITQTEQEVQTANYTVKFVDQNGTEIKEAAVRTGVVGQTITLNASDMENFYTDDMKYIYVENDVEGKTIADGDATVVTVKFREAAKYAWTAKSNVGTYTISGETWEGDKASVKYPIYQLVDGTLWQKPTDGKSPYALSFDVTEDNQEFTIEYTKSDITNVVYYAEMEDVEGMAVENSGNADARCSQRAVGYSASGSTKFAELEYGKYSITAAFYSPTSNGGNYKIYAGDRAIMEETTENANATVRTAEFVLAKSSDILLGQCSATAAVDYVFIQQLDDPTSEELAAAEAADALAEAKAELAETIAEAEEALAKGKEEVEAQYARTNPEATEEETAAHVTEFCAGFENAIAAAKAELASEEATVETLEAATDGLNVAIASFQQNVATGVVEVKATRQQNDAVYNLAGQRVLKAQKGLYIVNGKKVIK